MYTLKLGDETLEVSDGREEYGKLRLKYKKHSEKIMQDFLSRYDSIFFANEHVQANLERISQEYLSFIADIAIRDIILYDINDIDDDLFLNLYNIKNLSWADDISEVNDEYIKIVMNFSSQQEYLEFKNNNKSGGVIGGGFGLEGAVAGVAVASIANAAIGLVSGALNTVGEGLNSVEVNRRLSQLFKNPLTKATLSDAIFKLIYNAHYTVVDIVTERKVISLFDVVTLDDEYKAQAILKNIKKSRIPNDKIAKCLIQCFGFNPFLEEIYLLWSQKVFNLEKDFELLSEKFGINFDFDLNSEYDVKISVDGKSNEDLMGGMLEIIHAHTSKGLYIYGDIPERKINGAISNYFLSSDDILIGLIDSTVFGSADVGMGLGLKGLYWKNDGKESVFNSWAEIAKLSSEIEKTFLGIKICGEVFLPGGSEIKKEILISLISNLAGHYSFQNSHSNGLLLDN
jgi:hypothetical protein